MSIHHDLEDDVSESGFTRFLVDSPLKVQVKENSRILTYTKTRVHIDRCPK